MPRALKILLFTDGLYFLAAAMLGPIYAVFVEKIGGDLLTAGTSFAVFSFVMGVLILLFGKIEDAFLKETELWICAGYLVTAVGFFCYLLIESPWHLFIVQAIIGIGRAISSPAYSAIYSKHLNYKKAAFQWGAWDSMTNLAIGGGAIVGSLLAATFGFQILFVIMGTLSLLSCFVILLLPRKIL